MIRTQRTFLCVLLALALAAGCTGTTAPPPAATVVPTLVLPTATATPQPTPTAIPTSTATSLPTDTPTPEPSPTPTPVVLIGAGDISFCGEEYQGDEQTAEILDRYPEAHIFTAGDNAYGKGRAAEFRNCFDPTWGRHKDRIRPSPGNHDYMTDSANPYFDYFGEAAGEPGQGFYSYDLGDWHIVSLNSNCDDISCRPGSRQVEWLLSDLAASEKRCTLMYWHHPRFSSGLGGDYGSVNSFWRAAVDYGVEVIVNGHDHGYERFAPQDLEGKPHPTGPRIFVAGTGGSPLRAFGEIKPNSEVRYNESHGVLKFNLYPDRYEWEFIPVEGFNFTDSGSAACH